MNRKRKTDIWNEKAEAQERIAEVKADEFADNVAHNREGISADKEKFILDDTTTPKVLKPDRGD
ncbi:MAG: hypothetical protein ACYC21_04755 [Eubacteriales bacterium]